MSNKTRSQFLIYPKFQLLMVFIQLIVLSFSLIPLGLVLMRSFVILEQTAQQSGLPAENGFFHFLQVQKTLILGSAFWPVLAGVLVNLAVTVWLSDKLVGPIVRLKREFSEMETTGQAKEISFRKGDFFMDLPPIVNRAIQRLKK